MSEDLLTRRIAIEVVTKQDGSWAKGDDWNYSTTNKTAATLDGEYDYSELVPVPWCDQHECPWVGDVCRVIETLFWEDSSDCHLENPVKHWRVE